MDNSYLALGSPVPFECFGDMELLYPLTIGNFGTIEAWLLNQPEPIERVVTTARIPNEYVLGLLDAKLKKKRKRSYNYEEIETYLNDIEGIILSFWLMLRQTRTFRECKLEVESWDNKKTTHFIKTRTHISGFDWRAEREFKGVNFWDDIEHAKRQKEAQNPKPKRMNWKYMVRQFVEAYTGSLPNDYQDITYFQFRCIADSKQSVQSGGYSMTIGKWRSMSKEERQRFAKESGGLVDTRTKQERIKSWRRNKV